MLNRTISVATYILPALIVIVVQFIAFLFAFAIGFNCKTGEIECTIGTLFLDFVALTAPLAGAWFVYVQSNHKQNAAKFALGVYAVETLFILFIISR